MDGGDSNHRFRNDNQQQQQQWMAMRQYQQQWMTMQYPAAAAMVMQQQMMYGQHYMPYYHHHQQQLYQQQQQPQQKLNQMQSSTDEKRTIWIGDLQQWMDDAYLRSCFESAGEVVSVKIIRNRQTGQSERYGFVEFSSHATAEKVLQSYNGIAMPNTEQTFRLNWAAFSTGDRHADGGSDLSVFAGDLASDVTDELLHETFASRYPSVKSAKVVVDSSTGRSKGYGFVRFGDENERSQAMTEMNGVYCSSRPIRVGVATPKKPSTQQLYASQAVILSGGYASNGAAQQGCHSDGDSSNTTIFVGGLDSDVTDEELRESFTKFGEVVSVKIPAGKGCGFVQFAERSKAEDAMQNLNGTVIGKQAVRLSWGRTPGNRQWNRAYYSRQGQSGNVVSQYQNPSMYAAGVTYGAASNVYGNHQQPVS